MRSVAQRKLKDRFGRSRGMVEESAVPNSSSAWRPDSNRPQKPRSGAGTMAGSAGPQKGPTGLITNPERVGVIVKPAEDILRCLGLAPSFLTAPRVTAASFRRLARHRAFLPGSAHCPACRRSFAARRPQQKKRRHPQLLRSSAPSSGPTLGVPRVPPARSTCQPATDRIARPSRTAWLSVRHDRHRRHGGRPSSGWTRPLMRLEVSRADPTAKMLIERDHFHLPSNLAHTYRYRYTPSGGCLSRHNTASPIATTSSTPQGTRVSGPIPTRHQVALFVSACWWPTTARPPPVDGDAQPGRWTPRSR